MEQHVLPSLRDDSFERIVPYLLKNEPVLVRGCTKGWDLDANAILYPEDDEELCRTLVPVDIEGKARTSMELVEFLDVANGAKAHGSEIYCKDWHIDQSPLKDKYTVPRCFRDDWLNWFCHSVEGEDDYSFCYVGSKGSSTKFHHDVCYSYSWSVNLCGVKRWRLWPEEGQNVDPYIEVLQQPGDAIFVPSGCNHEVENLGNNGDDGDLVVSVNRNWLNGFNINRVFRFIKREHDNVQAELMDLYQPSQPQPAKVVFNSPPPLMSAEEWHRHCDVILLANAAMNWKMFLRLLTSRLLLMASALPFLDADIGPEKTDMMMVATRIFCGEGYVTTLDPESLELFRIQFKTLLPGDHDASSVWSHTLSEVGTVLESIRGDDGLLLAFMHIFSPHPRDTLVSALGELLFFCRGECMYMY